MNWFMSFQNRLVEKATTFKSRLEQRQRDEAKERAENGETWKTKAFHENGEHWVYNHPLPGRSKWHRDALRSPTSTHICDHATAWLNLLPWWFCTTMCERQGIPLPFRPEIVERSLHPLLYNVNPFWPPHSCCYSLPITRAWSNWHAFQSERENYLRRH